MTEILDDMTSLRKRWRRVRSQLHLTDPAEPLFATGGVPEFIETPRARLLILPADPEHHLVEFDEKFWKWWTQVWPDPSTGQRADWGPKTRPTASAAVRFGQPSDTLDRYVALYHHGGLEVGLGRDAGRRREQTALFRLVTMVGRIRAGLALYGAVRSHFNVSGPWEVSLALRDATGSFLCEFAPGWADVDGHGIFQPRTTNEPGFLIRREIREWPEADDVRALAYSLGGQIEDAWGTEERRFLSRVEGTMGEFDRSKYRWE